MDDEMGLTEFFGIRVPPGKEVDVGHTPGPMDDSLDTIHLSQVALGPDAKPGRHVVWVRFSGQKSVIGSVTLGGIEQFQIDFPVNRELQVSHSGPSDVYLTGYTTHQFLPLEYSDSDDEDDDDSDEDGVVMRNGRHRLSGADPLGGDDEDDSEEDSDYQDGDDDDDDGGDEDVDDEDDDDEDEGVGAGILDLGGNNGRRVELESDDDDEGNQGFLPLADTPGGGIAPHIDSDEEDESDEDDDADDVLDEGDDDDEDDDDDDEDDDDDDDMPQFTPGGKRKSAGTPTAAPASQPKKAKTAEKAEAATPRGGNDGVLAEYEKTLSKFLKANGPTKMAVIGSQVSLADRRMRPLMNSFGGAVQRRTSWIVHR